MNINLKESDVKTAQLILQGIKIPSPEEMIRQLEDLGYHIGCNRKDVEKIVLFAWEHAQNAKAVICDNMDIDTVIPPGRMILTGFTGSGKTLLLTMLFEQILQFPVVVVDMSCFSESGLYGEDISEIPTRLFHKAHRNLGFAACGLIVLDEFDKLGTNSDASYGRTIRLQESLLPLLERRGSYEFYSEFAHSKDSSRKQLRLPLTCLSVVAAGAFTKATKQMDALKNKKSLGFNHSEEISLSPSQQSINMLQKHSGLMIELIGRFDNVVNLRQKSAQELLEILNKTLLPKYHSYYNRNNVDLCFSDSSKLKIAEMAIDRKTGVRGLNSIIKEELSGIGFGCFGKPGEFFRATLDIDDNTRIKCEIKSLTLEEAEKTNIIINIKPDTDTENIAKDPSVKLIDIMEEEVSISGLVEQSGSQSLMQRVIDTPFAPHPKTTFDEDKFRTLLAASISLTLSEKLKILSAVGRLSQEQIDSLMDIFLDEKSKVDLIDKKQKLNAAKLSKLETNED